MADRRLRREEHLRRRADFEATYKRRRSAADERLVLYVRPNGLSFSRLGLSVPGRLGGAVDRNRFRRRAREAFRLHKDELPKGYDIILIPRKRLDRTVAEIHASLYALTERLCDEPRAGP